MSVAIPHSVLAGGWIPFVVVVVLAFIFAWVYIRLFQHHEMSEVSSTLTSIIALFITLLTTALVPVDVFLVSYMKHANGTFKSWAADNSTRASLEDTITYTYYTLYGLVGLFVFIILPFMYFYYEEKDDDDVTVKQRCCTSMKYCIVFLVFAFAILLTGALIPLKQPPKNMTEVDDKFIFLKGQLETYTHARNAMSVLVGVMSMFGMFTLVLYTGYGMSALPLGMIRCWKKYDDKEVSNPRRLTRKERDEEKARILRAKSRAGRNLTRFERNELRRIEQSEQLQHRIDRKKNKMGKSWCGKLGKILKPFEVFFGIAFLGISLLMMISLTITSVDKSLHSLGYKFGYALPTPILPNPVNIVMVKASKVFPLDYVLFSGMALFFIFASMNGIKRMGIWCCCIRMFKIRANRTMPQALLFMVFIMMFMVMGLTIILFTITPQYVQYGNQHYATSAVWDTSTNKTVTKLKECSTDAPEGKCTMSRLALLLNTLFYNAWFFGAFYYWSIWLFVGIFYLGLIFNLINTFRTRSEAEMVSSDDDSSDSDTERLIKA